MKLCINIDLSGATRELLQKCLGNGIEIVVDKNATPESLKEFDYGVMVIDTDGPTKIRIYSSADKKHNADIVRTVRKDVPLSGYVESEDLSYGDDVVYFELNNWTPGKYYPDSEPFKSWLGNDLNLTFMNEEFVKENKLCVVWQLIDMSVDFCITATRSWVEENCPELLTTHERFRRYPDPLNDGDVYSDFDAQFLEYAEKNIGLHEEEPW